MNKTATIILILLALALLGSAGLALSDDDQDSDDDDHRKRWSRDAKPGVVSALQQQYVDECGSCHFPYQPGFLPAQSWERVKSGLEDHFGENAELPAEDARQIGNYLRANAAGAVSDGVANRSLAALQGRQGPIRITETRFFRREHDDLTRRMVQDNPQVGSFSNCEACHTRAMEGSFDEHQVRIPGYGRWDD